MLSLSSRRHNNMGQVNANARPRRFVDARGNFVDVIEEPGGGYFAFCRDYRIGVLLLALIAVFVGVSHYYNAGFYLGKDGSEIPALRWKPDDHLPSLVRDHPDFVSAILKEARNVGYGEAWKRKHDQDMEYLLHGRVIDYGGKDGEWAEEIDYSSPSRMTASMQVTRCSTVALALSYYYCGKAATDLSTDADYHAGIRGLKALLKRERKKAEAGTGVEPTFQRTVVSLAVHSRIETEPSLNHVLVIVQQPDGTYLWLQSYISHYSLFDWLAFKKKTSGSYHFSSSELVQRLTMLEVLEKKDVWDDEANRLYHQLFHVDILKASKIRSRSGLKLFSWSKENRLDAVWKKVCTGGWEKAEKE